jgi:hypothetical protein
VACWVAFTSLQRLRCIGRFFAPAEPSAILAESFAHRAAEVRLGHLEPVYASSGYPLMDTESAQRPTAAAAGKAIFCIKTVAPLLRPHAGAGEFGAGKVLHL